SFGKEAIKDRINFFDGNEFSCQEKISGSAYSSIYKSEWSGITVVLKRISANINPKE
ncbi:4083_t:CDS:1, partial [Racocetra persica]